MTEDTEHASAQPTRTTFIQRIRQILAVWFQENPAVAESHVEARRIQSRLHFIFEQYGIQASALVVLGCQDADLTEWVRLLVAASAGNNPPLITPSAYEALLAMRADLAQMTGASILLTHAFADRYLHMLDTFVAWLPLDPHREYHYAPLEETTDA
jgi:hypothetical protein